MFLKQLYLHGFKSFADRTIIEFVPGITAIVGPNGSGKSNISDAIRWVLGEPSAKSIRGTRMEDIIFAGSDQRRPLGMAEVSLTLDNSDGALPVEFSEVTITRRYFRSGESEFLINRTPCRLRDIQELFMDTGLGREALSHVGQGQIDAILSARPEDRRLFLEEAAGITRYKARRAEAVRKLEDTDQKLIRVNDIISELSERLGPLETEAKKTRRHNELQEQLKAAETTLLSVRWKRTRESWKHWEEERQRLDSEIVVREKEISRIEKERADLRHQTQEIRAAVEQVAAALTAREDGLVSKEQRIGILKERIDNLRDRVKETEESLVRYRQQLEDNEKDLLAKEQAFEAGKQELADLRASLDSLVSNRSRRHNQFEELEEEVRKCRSSILSETGAVAALESRKQYIQNQLINIEERRRLLTSRLEAEEAEHARLLESAQQTKTQVVKGEEQLEQSKSEIERLKSRRTELENELRERRKETARLQSVIDRKVSRLQALKDLEESYEGYHPGVKQVMQSNLSGVCGVVAELFSAPHEFALALEIALGGSLQNIVTVDSESAKEAIAFLKSNRAGRATFLPLADLSSSRLNLPSDLPSGTIGLAVDLIQFDPVYRPAMQYLLGRVIVTENLDVALKVSKKVRGFSRIVTKDGDLIAPGGAMTGGSHARNTGLLLRRQEADRLENDLKGDRAGLQERQENLEKLEKEILTVNSKLDAQTEELQKLKVRLSQEEARLLQLENEAERVQSSIRNLNHEVSGLAAEREDLFAESMGIEEEIAASRQKLTRLQAEIDKLESAKEERRRGTASFEEELTRLRVNEASLRERCSALQSELKAAERNIDDLKKAIDTADTRLKQDLADIDHWQEEIALLQQDREKEIKEAELLRAQAAEHRSRLDGIAKMEEEVLQALREQEGIQKSFRDKLHSVELELGRLEMQTRQLEERLLENWGLKLEELSFPPPESSESSLASQVSRLKAALQELGPVNPAAIEQYETLVTRYEYLSRQREDLVSAEKTLREAIAEIDRTTEERLAGTLTEVRCQFSRMFTRLFGGGKADLALTDQDNILESGIEIIAQPPGKKPQNLLLLSGGERALTAIALLFAVLSVSPSPFCVLDEIDAALDEANLDRYTEILNEFSHATQFIVVTHRQATMYKAGCLYGVTSEAGGISKLVSVKLDQEQN